MPEMIDIEQHIVELLKTVNAVDVIHKLNVTVKTYPSKKVTGRLNFGGAVQDFVLGGENTDAQQKEYILLLDTMLPETIEDTFHGINVLCELPPEYITAKRNKVIITGWIKEQRESHKLDTAKKDPVPEPSLTNVDLLNSIRSFLDEMETIFRLSGNGIEPIEEIRQRYNNMLGQLKRGGQTLFINLLKEEYFDLVWKVKQLVDVYREESWGTIQLTDCKSTIQELLNSEAAAEQYLTSIHLLRDEYLPDQPKEEPIPSPSLTNNGHRVIIQWNEQHNVLTDIFRQLKQIPNKEKEPAIGNSIPEVALFLKENFSCFSETKLSTIEGMLKNNEANNNTPKITRRIIIEREKLE